MNVQPNFNRTFSGRSKTRLIFQPPRSKKGTLCHVDSEMVYVHTFRGKDAVKQLRGYLRGLDRCTKTPDANGWVKPVCTARLTRAGIRANRGNDRTQTASSVCTQNPYEVLAPCSDPFWEDRSGATKTSAPQSAGLQHRTPRRTVPGAFPAGVGDGRPFKQAAALSPHTGDKQTRLRVQDKCRLGDSHREKNEGLVPDWLDEHLRNQVVNFPVLTVDSPDYLRLGRGPSYEFETGRSGGAAGPVEDGQVSVPGSGRHCSNAEGGGSHSTCGRSSLLGKLARSVIRHLAVDTGIKSIKSPPLKIDCGGLRSAVRSCFSQDIPEYLELSIKTCQKLEDRFCDHCEDRFLEFVDKWETACFTPQHVSSGHVALFKRTFGQNVPQGWNKHQFPYVPNGHATLHDTRREGGNWNEGTFESYCRPELVLSSGKPRVITLYSEYNTRVLTPLHLSLYKCIGQFGWVLRGTPKPRHVEGLTGEGQLISLDYRGATDSFKTAYVRAAIESLIEKSEGLSAEQVRCLRVLGELRLSADGPVASRGQPMGSVMSFPLLCLFNKTVQDLALQDLFLQGTISFKEWTSHPTLINGDDSLTREPRRGRTDLYDRICHHGTMVGMVVNDEKSMRSYDKGEINSTLFVRETGSESAADGDAVSNQWRFRLEKKTNVAAIRMQPEVNDVLGFALESSRSLPGFLRLVLKNRKILAKQSEKCLWKCDARTRRALWDDPRIAASLTSLPRDKRDEKSGYLGMVAVPDGYSLPRDIEVETINSAVSEVRMRVDTFACDKPKKFRTVSCPNSKLPKTHKPTARDPLILECLARRFIHAKREELRTEELTSPGCIRVDEPFPFTPVGCIGVSRIVNIENSIRDFKSFHAPRRPARQGPDGPFVADYVGLNGEIMD